MKRFQFNLQAVLDLRKRMEDERKRTLAAAQRELFEQQGRLFAFLVDEKKGKEELRRMETSSIDLPQVLSQRRYLMAVARRIGGAQQELQRLLIVERQKREALVQATKERKVLEKLKERKTAEYQHLLSVDEQKTLDEIANTLYIQGMSQEPPAEA